LKIKNFVFFYLILFGFQVGFAQNVIVGAGSSEKNQNFQVDYSIGQIFFQDTPKSDYIGLRTTYKEGVHQVYYVDAGVRSLNFDVVAKAYPNPTKDIFNISLDMDVNDFSGLTYSIHSPQGQLIITDTLKTNPFSIDISGFSTGVYFIYIYSNLNQTKLIKIIKN
tara:strand:- start:448 stop:942 length:495 start_codon:yes stop_codon:yes gene_type:complete